MRDICIPRSQLTRHITHAISRKTGRLRHEPEARHRYPAGRNDPPEAAPGREGDAEDGLSGGIGAVLSPGGRRRSGGRLAGVAPTTRWPHAGRLRSLGGRYLFLAVTTRSRWRGRRRLYGGRSRRVARRRGGRLYRGQDGRRATGVVQSRTVIADPATSPPARETPLCGLSKGKGRARASRDPCT